MLFNTNDNNQLINSGNYEEYFILYMDNELNDAEMKMVDEFLAKHPELQAEFDMLLSTKLPEESFVFDKNSLLADNMKLNTVDENLLLLVDNELPAAQIPSLQQKISADKDLQLQHELLLKTKLDASEVIPYPNKKELYRRTGSIIAFRPWMRVAAAAVVILLGGVLYFNSERSASVGGTAVADIKKSNNTPSVHTNNPVQLQGAPAQNDQSSNEPSQVAINKPSVQKENTKDTKENSIIDHNEQPQDQIAYKEPAEGKVTDRLPRTADLIQGQTISEPVASINLPQQSINNSPVTSALQDRNTNTEPEIRNPEVEGSVANAPVPSSRSGSLKGFLRKATRVIEKRTGIASSSDDGEILIGALAVKVK